MVKQNPFGPHEMKWLSLPVGCTTQPELPDFSFLPSLHPQAPIHAMLRMWRWTRSLTNHLPFFTWVWNLNVVFWKVKFKVIWDLRVLIVKVRLLLIPTPSPRNNPVSFLSARSFTWCWTTFTWLLIVHSKGSKS